MGTLCFVYEQKGPPLLYQHIFGLTALGNSMSRRMPAILAVILIATSLIAGSTTAGTDYNTTRSNNLLIYDDESGNWTELDDKQTTDQEWIVEQGCDAPTEQQLSDTNLAEVLNDYGQVMVAESDWSNNTMYDMVAATSTGHDDSNDPMIHFETRIVSGCSGQLCRGVIAADEPIYMRNTAIQIGPDIVIEISVSEEFSGNSTYRLITLRMSDGNGGTITEYDYTAGISYSGAVADFRVMSGNIINKTPEDIRVRGLSVSGASFNGTSVIFTITNSTGYEVINVTQTHGLIDNNTMYDSNNTMYDSYDGATVQTNTHISIAKALNIYAVLTGGNESTSARGVRSGYDVDLSYSETTVWVNGGEGIIADNSANPGGGNTAIALLDALETHVGFGEDGDVTEANIIKTNFTIEMDTRMTPTDLRNKAILIDSPFANGGEDVDDVGSTFSTSRWSNNTVYGVTFDPSVEIESCENGVVKILDEDTNLEQKNRVADNDEKQEDSEILVSAAGVDVTERDAVTVGGTFAVTSILWMIGRRYLGGV